MGCDPAVNHVALLEPRALVACIEYDRRAREIREHTVAIAETRCPLEDAEPPAGEYDEPESHFAIARSRVLGPEGEGPTLDGIADEVADCEPCSRLVELIRERKHAKQRWGVAKRAIRQIGRASAAARADGESGSDA